MSSDTKELLAFSGLLALMPIAMVSYLGSTIFIALLYFSWMDPMEAMLVSAVIAGIMNGGGFFAFMMGFRFATRLYQKIKGEK